MRRAFVLLVLAAGCGKEPDLPPPPPPPVPPALPAALKAAEKVIAFVRGGNLWTVRPDGTGARQVTRLEGGGAGDPAWSPDRAWIAFAAGLDGDSNLLARNLFVVRPDGTDLRQITPLPRAGLYFEDAPKGPVRGRAVVQSLDGRRPAPRLRVTAYGTRRSVETEHDGTFQLLVPAGAAWVKVAGDVEGRSMGAMRLTPVPEGRGMELGDMVLQPGSDDAAAAPSWSPDGTRIAYQLRRGRAEHAGPVHLRRIRADGADDETVHAPDRVSIVGGPILRGGAAWFKSSDGKVQRVELDTRRVSEGFDPGVSVPDALALSPDGTALATLRFEASGAPALVLLGRGRPEVLASFGGEGGVPRALDFSPDGSKLVLDRRAGEKSDLWTLDLATRAFARLTEDGASSDPVWNGR